MAFKTILHDQGEKLDLAEELREEFHAQAKDALEGAANIVIREVDRLLTRRRGTKRTSAPQGEPPEFDEGSLAISYRILPGRVKGNVASAGIQSKDPGANRLEFGKTDNRGIRTFPHPHVRPAFENTAEDVTRYLEEHLL